MDSISLVTTALEYYDMSNELHKNTLKNAHYVKFIQAENDMEHNTAVFFDTNKEEIYRSKYEIIGLYDSDSNTWAWSWAIPRFKKNNTNIARKIWNYGAVLDPSVGYLKTELITSRFRVADPIQLDIHVSIASYLSKNQLIYKHINYITKTPDVDGYLHIGETINDAYTIYYMFLLDSKKESLEKI
jgi:hypothetical protein